MVRLVAAAAVFFAAVMPLPALSGQDDARLGPLFEALLSAESATEAQPIEEEIWHIWTRAGITRIDDEMTRGIVAMNLGILDRSLDSFTAVVEAAPRFAEGWNKRATVHYMMRNYDASVRDIERTLALEPRHFGAISGLGLIYSAIGNDGAALKAFEKALAIHPNLPGARANVRELRDKIEGRAI